MKGKKLKDKISEEEAGEEIIKTMTKIFNYGEIEYERTQKIVHILEELERVPKWLSLSILEKVIEIIKTKKPEDDNLDFNL